MTIAVILVALGLLCTVPSRAKILIRGCYNGYIKRIAKTPQGLEAIYLEAISAAQDKYTTAKRILANLNGKQRTLEKRIDDTKNTLYALEKTARKCTEKGMDVEAETVAEEWNLKMEALRAYEDQRIDLAKFIQDAEMVYTNSETEVNRLKAEKDYELDKLIHNTQMLEMYNDMDNIRSKKDVGHLLNTIKDESRKTAELATGTRMLHENKSSTKMETIRKEIRKEENLAFLEELKKGPTIQLIGESKKELLYIEREKH